MRPSEYKEEYCAVVLAYVGEDGRSVKQLARHLRCSVTSIYRWAADFPEFGKALEMAIDWAEALWEQRYTDSYMLDKSVNAQLVQMYYISRFKWSAKGEDNKLTPPPTTIIIQGPADVKTD